MLFDTLKICNSTILNLNLSRNELDDDCIENLTNFLQDNKHLKTLSLSSNKITDKGIELLSACLIGNISLDFLSLEGNSGITDTSFPFIVDMAKISHLKSIYIPNTSLSDEKIHEIKNILNVPASERKIPLKSNSKSAAKV